MLHYKSKKFSIKNNISNVYIVIKFDHSNQINFDRVKIKLCEKLFSGTSLFKYTLQSVVTVIRE